MSLAPLLVTSGYRRVQLYIVMKTLEVVLGGHRFEIHESCHMFCDNSLFISVAFLQH